MFSGRQRDHRDHWIGTCRSSALLIPGKIFDSDNFGTAQTITAATVSGTSGITLVTSVNFSQAQLPTSLGAGDMYRIRIRRDVTNDTATGDAELYQTWK